MHVTMIQNKGRLGGVINIHINFVRGSTRKKRNHVIIKYSRWLFKRLACQQRCDVIIFVLLYVTHFYFVWFPFIKFSLKMIFMASLIQYSELLKEKLSVFFSGFLFSFAKKYIFSTIFFLFCFITGLIIHRNSTKLILIKFLNYML